MKILYGVCGEGMGHATRTKVTLAHLTARGHDVLVLASDQALRVLRSLSTSGEAAVRAPPSSSPSPDGLSPGSSSRACPIRAERPLREQSSRPSLGDALRTSSLPFVAAPGLNAIPPPFVAPDRAVDSFDSSPPAASSDALRASSPSLHARTPPQRGGGPFHPANPDGMPPRRGDRGDRASDASQDAPAAAICAERPLLGRSPSPSLGRCATCGFALPLHHALCEVHLANATNASSARKGRVKVVPIVGLGMRCADGAMDLRGTLEENAQRLPRMMMENAAAWSEAEAFRPDVVITDYDSFAWFFARAKGLPFVSIDNAQILPRCIHLADVLAPHHDGMRALEIFTNAKAEGAAHYIVTSFFYPPVKPHFRATTTVVPPILRSEVLAALQTPWARETHDHVLVYKTSSLDDATIVEPLAAVPDQRFFVYGLRGTIAALPANVEAKPFDSTTFLRDLATARAVVANSGMSLLGEALAFGKPMYTVPVRGQYEQVLNACYLQRLGYGVASDVLDPARLRAFLARRAFHEDAIRRTPQHDSNARLYATLDRFFPPA